MNDSEERLLLRQLEETARRAEAAAWPRWRLGAILWGAFSLIAGILLLGFFSAKLGIGTCLAAALLTGLIPGAVGAFRPPR